jgi:CelD/BcsL family acetyltransferase involved in cellulose biosynthesis
MSSSDSIGALLFGPRNASVRQAMPLAPRVGVATAPYRVRPVHATPAGNHALQVEARPLSELGEIRDAWAGLAERALERNVFAEPVFVLAAAQHISEARNAAAVLVWERGDGPAALVGVFPIVWPRLPLLPNALRTWRSSYAPLGVPLVDRTCGERVVDAFMGFLAARVTRCAAAIFAMVPECGPFAQVVEKVANRRGLSLNRLDAHVRAVLPSGTDELLLSPKKLKELKRQLRRLGELGEVHFERHREPCAVRAALETFLAVEASGWKSNRGTALVQDTGAATFVRTMVRELARDGRCRIDLLKVGATAIAAGIVIESGDRAYFWKVAYDEAYARYSPGVQLTLALTQRQLERKSIAVTDSCAIADHPMIDRLWRSRMSIVDLVVSSRPAPWRPAAIVIAREEARRGVRAIAKAAYYRLRGGKLS